MLRIALSTYESESEREKLPKSNRDSNSCQFEIRFTHTHIKKLLYCLLSCNVKISICFDIISFAFDIRDAKSGERDRKRHIFILIFFTSSFIFNWTHALCTSEASIKSIHSQTVYVFRLNFLIEIVMREFGTFSQPIIIQTKTLRPNKFIFCFKRYHFQSDHRLQWGSLISSHIFLQIRRSFQCLSHLHRNESIIFYKSSDGLLEITVIWYEIMWHCICWPTGKFHSNIFWSKIQSKT